MDYSHSYLDLINHPFDHLNTAFSCLPEHEDLKNPYSLFKGGFSSTRRCLYKRDTYEILLDFGM